MKEKAHLLCNHVTLLGWVCTKKFIAACWFGFLYLGRDLKIDSRRQKYVSCVWGYYGNMEEKNVSNRLDHLILFMVEYKT